MFWKIFDRIEQVLALAALTGLVLAVLFAAIGHESLYICLIAPFSVT